MIPETISPAESFEQKVDLPSRPQAKFSKSEVMNATDIGWEILAAETEPYWPVPEKFNCRLNSKEIANPDARYYDIFNLSENESQELSEKIAQNDGLIRVFVHPYYSLHEIHCQAQIDDLERIDAMLGKILVNKKEKRPPVIIMEDYQAIEDLYELLKSFNEDDIYIAPTFSDSSQPYPQNDSVQMPKKEVGCKNWAAFIDLLDTLGVRKIIIGGQYISVQSMQSARSNDDRYGQCLGFAVNNLRKNFQLRISNAANLTRSEIAKLFEDQSEQSGHNFVDNL
jgi:hypothetical protein